MKTYADVRAQIEQLEKEAQDLRKSEISQVLAQIKEQMATYGLTVADLGRKGVSGAKYKSSGVVKYRDPKSGSTWTGHGKPPQWIAHAKNRDAFLIEKLSEETPSDVVGDTPPDVVKEPKAVAKKTVKAPLATAKASAKKPSVKKPAKAVA